MITTIAALAAFTTTLAPAIEHAGPCKDSLDVAIFVSPNYPNAKAPLRINIASETDFPNAAVVALDPKGEQHVLDIKKLGGPPFGWVGKIDKPGVGKWRIAIATGDTIHACQKVRVRTRGGRKAVAEVGVDPVWTPRIKWERDTENLFSIWIEHLFEAPPDAQPTWRPLHEVLRNADRNILFDHLHLGEDGPGTGADVVLKPDCADFPYHLRAYFAWKMRLPFAYRRCRRGSQSKAPICSREYDTNMSMLSQKELVVRSFQHFARREVGRSVHSSSPRTLPSDERSDFYPVAMTRHGIRPGTIFADPYGHILVVAKWLPQSDGKPGVLFAVDAQPDATVGRRRFWRGSFLFPEDGAVSGAGFKRFRPTAFRRKDGSVFVHDNAFIKGSKDYGDLSLEQWTVGKDLFYERMDALINPEPMSPRVAFGAALDALTEQVERRVLSVDTGEAWLARNSGKIVEMPERDAIFQTAGPWEEYSTPSRDMRLLIAIQSTIDYPRRVVKYKERFELPVGLSPEEAQKKLEESLMADAANRKIVYTRTDGSKFTISVADVINRRQAMEMAYNPNDCPELRWGAPEGSDELSTCKRHAPAEQREKMATYREWFQKRQRPLN